MKLELGAIVPFLEIRPPLDRQAEQQRAPSMASPPLDHQIGNGREGQ
jgi:hypothetical protein